MADPSQSSPDLPEKPPRFVDRALNAIERVGNKLPDPAALFFILLVVVWILSAIFASVSFSEIDPRTGQPIVIKNQLAGTSIAAFLAGMVTTFTSFHPLGVVLVALLGVGVAEHTGFINACLKGLLSFTSAWLLTPMLIEVDGDPADLPRMENLGPKEKRGLFAGLAALFVGLLILFFTSAPGGSVLRAPDGSLTASTAPLMQSIVPLIFLLFLIPGMVYGYVAGTVQSHRDIIKGMSKTMSTMGYYIVLAFFAALFIAAFGQSNLGALLALKGAGLLQAMNLPGAVTMIGIILLTASVNLLIGSASAKWALLAPVFVPMLMTLGFSPELTQAAYRVGDSTTNIITPLMPYFPLVVVFAQRYVKKTGIGTLVSLMLPYSITFLVLWTAFLLLYWMLGIPLGLQAPYTYP
ncbi:MAG: AbgT family transporter [Verrucomicrobiaceae bacterium]|nr:AbgT family transporter [Verrucomicrobiaceae bacterium]